MLSTRFYLEKILCIKYDESGSNPDEPNYYE